MRADEEEWEEHGHLSRLLTAKKKISNSKIWKTLPLITDFHMDDGGYTSRVTKFDGIPNIKSLEDGMRKGFVVVKSENW
jgi:hypothetical protein